MCMKCNIPNNVRMVGLVILGLVVIYIALSIFASTREGLSDGTTTSNAAVIKTTQTNQTNASTVMGKLPASTNAYVDLINSYKYLKLANGINDVAAGKTTMLVSDCDHAIDYLNELSGTITTKPSSSLDSLPTPNTSLTR